MAPVNPETLAPAAARLYAQFVHLEVDGAAEGYPWAVLAAALAAPLEPLYALLTYAERPWGAALDPDVMSEALEPLAAAGVLPVDFASAMLAWLGQFAGVTRRQDLAAAGERLRLRETSGYRRGTRPAIDGAARQRLVGPDGTPETATVFVTERIGGSPYVLAVATLASETPDAVPTAYGGAPINEVTNPSFEAPGTPGWNADGTALPALARIATWAKVGDHSGRVTRAAVAAGGYIAAITPAYGVGGFPLTVDVGGPVAARATFRVLTAPPAGHIALSISFWTAAGVFVSQVDTVQSISGAASGTEHELAGTGDRPATAAFATLGLQGFNTGGAAADMEYAVDAAVFAQGVSAVGYFDGDTPGHDWDGAPHASTSSSPTAWSTPPVERDLEEQVPAGRIWTYHVIAGGSWATLYATHTDWADVEASFATWADVRADPSA